MHNETPSAHNETQGIAPSHTEFRYADQEIRYAQGEFRYALPEFRYAHREFRYAQGEIRYAHPEFRYAQGKFCYAYPEFRYAGTCFGLRCMSFPCGDAWLLKCAGCEADGKTNMLKRCGAMSNGERQRDFLERHPGYYAEYRRRKKAELEALRAAKALAAAEAAVTVTRREQLMLPAPVETIEIPGVNAIPAVLQAPAAEKVAVGRKITVPSAFASFFAD